MNAKRSHTTHRYVRTTERETTSLTHEVISKMDIPITNPHISANLEDNSRVDDSFKQQGTTVNLGTGATYNQNCGNKREMSRAMSTIIGVLFSFTCDIFIIGCLIFSFDKLCEKLQDFDRDVTTKFEKVEKRAAETHKDIM